MIEIFNGIKGKWESISAIGLPDGYTIEIFVPARGRINGRNQGYRVKKGSREVAIESTRDSAIHMAKQDANEQCLKQNNEPDDDVRTPKLI